MSTAVPVRRKKRILVVEDDPSVRAIVAEVCRQQGHDVLEVGSGREGVQAGLHEQPDVVLLDWILPDISGIDVCREMRRQGVGCPVIMITGRSAKVDEVVGLEVGADDYITKPFDSRVLAARLAANLRRAEQLPSSKSEHGLTVGEVEIDIEGRRVKVNDEEIKLTMTEFDLLALLAANPGRVLTRQQLLEKVWGYLADVDYHSVDPHIQRLRKKLSSFGDSGVNVEAVPGLGYRLATK